MKKIICIALSLLVLFALIGCSNNEPATAPEGQEVDSNAQSNDPQQNAPDGSDANAAVPATPSVPHQTLEYEGLRLFVPESWQGSKVNDSYTVISNDYYNDLGSFIVLRNDRVPTLNSEGALSESAVRSLLTELIGEGELNITSVDYNSKVGALSAIQIKGNVTMDELALYFVTFVTAEPNLKNFLLAAANLDGTKIDTYCQMFDCTQVIG